MESLHSTRYFRICKEGKHRLARMFCEASCKRGFTKHVGRTMFALFADVEIMGAV